MLVVLPFHNGDWQLARTLLEWCQYLRGCKRHSLLLLPAEAVRPQSVAEVQKAAAKVFNSTRLLPAVPGLPDETWPKGANAMFRAALQHTWPLQRPWLWLEPDCVPMRSGWLDALESAYLKCRKPFLGHFIKTNSPKLPEYVMTGVAIYPPNCSGLWPRLKHPGIAFDVAISPGVIRQAHDSPLIWQYWGTKNISPTFTRSPIPPKNRYLVGLWHIPKTCVLFHRCKNGSLIQLLKLKTINHNARLTHERRRELKAA